MSGLKGVVERFMDSFNRLDHEQILSCLTDDVEWVLPGMFTLVGKVAFDGEIENPAFEGKPLIKVSRMVEERNVVVAEGTVRTKKKGEGYMDVAFCDVFEFEGELVRKLTSYLVPLG